MWAGHEGGGALPVAQGTADVRVAGHHYPQAPAPPIHWGVHTALNWKLQITSTFILSRENRPMMWAFFFLDC